MGKSERKMRRKIRMGKSIKGEEQKGKSKRNGNERLQGDEKEDKEDEKDDENRMREG